VTGCHRTGAVQFAVLFDDDPGERAERLAELCMIEQLLHFRGLVLGQDVVEADEKSA
jgi:hypothetical protein